MAKISMSDISPELTPEELQELEAAEKMPVIFDEDCPEMTEKMLQQFHRMDSVVVKISPANIEKVNHWDRIILLFSEVKSLGPDYPSILSHLLNLALNDSDLLKKCI